MKHRHYFGYGSLVNRATHDHPEARPASITGWRRQWRHTALRPVAFLTAVPDPLGHIDGLIAEVPGGNWAALDQRERAYDRVMTDHHEAVQIYTIPEGKHGAPTQAHPVLLSYIDVVVQGYLREFGEDGVARFFASTHGWDAPVANDRAAPRYSRHQPLTRAETALVDHHLRDLSVRILSDA